MIKAVLWDLDGVLVDSYAMIFRCYEKTLQKFEKKAVLRDHLIKLLGGSGRDILKMISNAKDEAEFERMFNYFADESAKISANIALVDGAGNVLRQLSGKYLQGIVSSRRRRSLDAILKRNKIDKYFQAVIAYEDVENPKPHPEPILKALEILEVESLNAVYIGDMNEDIRAGLDAGVKMIAYRNFYNKHVNFELADHVVEDLRHIPNIVDKL